MGQLAVNGTVYVSAATNNTVSTEVTVRVSDISNRMQVISMLFELLRLVFS